MRCRARPVRCSWRGPATESPTPRTEANRSAERERAQPGGDASRPAAGGRQNGETRAELGREMHRRGTGADHRDRRALAQRVKPGIAEAADDHRIEAALSGMRAQGGAAPARRAPHRAALSMAAGPFVVGQFERRPFRARPACDCAAPRRAISSGPSVWSIGLVSWYRIRMAVPIRELPQRVVDQQPAIVQRVGDPVAVTDELRLEHPARSPSASFASAVRRRAKGSSCPAACSHRGRGRRYPSPCWPAERVRAIGA